jgi:hypothetical protein
MLVQTMQRGRNDHDQKSTAPGGSYEPNRAQEIEGFCDAFNSPNSKTSGPHQAVHCTPEIQRPRFEERRTVRHDENAPHGRTGVRNWRAVGLRVPKERQHERFYGDGGVP